MYNRERLPWDKRPLREFATTNFETTSLLAKLDTKLTSKGLAIFIGKTKPQQDLFHNWRKFSFLKPEERKVIPRSPCKKVFTDCGYVDYLNKVAVHNLWGYLYPEENLNEYRKTAAGWRTKTKPFFSFIWIWIHNKNHLKITCLNRIYHF